MARARDQVVVLELSTLRAAKAMGADAALQVTAELTFDVSGPQVTVARVGARPHDGVRPGRPGGCEGSSWNGRGAGQRSARAIFAPSPPPATLQSSPQAMSW